LKDEALGSLHSRAKTKNLLLIGCLCLIGLRERKEKNPRGRTRTRTLSVLSGAPLRWATRGNKIGTPGRDFACNLRVRSAALWTLSYGSMKRRRPDSQTDGSTMLCAPRNGEINGTHTRTAALTKPNATSLHHNLHLDPPVGAAPTSSPLQEERITESLPRRKICSREDLHLERPPSRGGMQRSYISGAKNLECKIDNKRSGCCRNRAGLSSSSARR
jgi:hypothetical protein